MKFICYCSLLLLMACGGSHASHDTQTLFKGDSGFIPLREGAAFFVSHGVVDTSFSGWKLYPDDTIGKYYRQPNGHFIACIIDYTGDSFETHLLLEIAPDGKILQNERYSHSNYPCCWHKHYDGFGKRGDYYYLITCNTGSGFCGGELYLFKSVLPQNDQESFPQGYWSNWGDGQCSRYVKGDVKIGEDSILIHYKVTEYEREDTLGRVAGTTAFDIKYFKQQGHWAATDSTLLLSYDLY